MAGLQARGGTVRPRLLDLFCGAGGAAMGYHRAGFEVVGVDIKPQPHYPFEFHRADTLNYPLDGFDTYHASPPCQAYSEATPMTTKGTHPQLIKAMHNILIKTGKPYVIENVEGARWHLENPIMLCGTMFGLKLWRHRWFEIWPIYMMSPFTCNHSIKPITVNPPANARRSQGGRDFNKEKIAMGIDWMDKVTISQAIPPAYTEYIGKYLMEAVLAAKRCSQEVMELGL
jgi:DNA (cytosine-5)-methyltransferase 1